MESLVILVIAAGLSAVVVWWGMGQPGGRQRPKTPRTIAVERRGSTPATDPEEERDRSPDDFVLLPTDAPAPAVEDGPSPARALVRLVLIIAFFAALGVAVLTVLGILVKNQLDQFFTGL